MSKRERSVQQYSDTSVYRHSYSFGGSAGGGYDFQAPAPYGSSGFKEPKRSKSSSSRSWNFRNDPEMKRKKRVASYKVFTVEGKVKESVRSSFRWIKHKYMEIRYGWF